MSTITAEPTDRPVRFIWQGLMAAFGRGSPREQMAASVILALVAYVSTLLSLGATALFIVLFTITFLIGLARFLWAVIRG